MIASGDIPTGSLDNAEEKVQSLHAEITEFLIREGVPAEKISDNEIRVQTVLYLVYWFHRLRNNKEEQARIRQHLFEYMGGLGTEGAVDRVLNDSSLAQKARIYTESALQPKRTVDLVVTRIEEGGEKDILVVERTYFPFGAALPGGFIKDSDEDNPLSLLPHVFAALRVAGEKVLRIESGAYYVRKTDDDGKPYIAVHGKEALPSIRIYQDDEGGYTFRENIKSVIRPSDPRHVVDTVAFRCELRGFLASDTLVWRSKGEIMSPAKKAGGLAFGHHREIIAHITAQTSIEKERGVREREFVRTLIRQPLETYRRLKSRFEAHGGSPETPVKELFPVVDRLLADMFRPDINDLCEKAPVIAGIRDKVVISLRHVALKNRVFCPYMSTMHAIGQAVAFFDIVAREKRGFYNNLPKDSIIEHNPRTTPYASYHMYRYKYRMNDLLRMVPEEILIPTYEDLSVTDLMRVRGVPIRFLGIATDFLYVDEFEQSPEEFYMHDYNHSWRMAMEDKAAEEKYGKTKDQLAGESNEFMEAYLAGLTVRSTDTEEEREKKKLKKIILFEIVHEDARPFLKDVVGACIQMKEGGSVPFEVPRIDPKTGYMDIVDTVDTGISTLSYVRNKLQYGFYDQVDAQLPQIVEPKYRSAEWIAKAAYEMLVELDIPPAKGADTDDKGYLSYEWLLRRTCAVGPDNIHGTDYVDPALKEFGDGAEKLNPKRYQAGES